jgi:hypothetical protein
MKSLVDELEQNIYERWLNKFDYGIQALLDRCDFAICGHEGKFNGITLRTTNKLVARALSKKRLELTTRARLLLGRNAEIKIIFWREELLGQKVLTQSVEDEDFLVAVPMNDLYGWNGSRLKV